MPYWKVRAAEFGVTVQGRDTKIDLLIEKGNDKVVIVLTDGANTYGDLSSTDPAGNKSTYAAYGYLQPGYNGSSVGQ